MKKFCLLSSLLFISLLLHSINYTIYFTGSGASNSIDSVIVQNLTKAITVTVPAGNVLNLTDIVTPIETTSHTSDVINIFPNPIYHSSTLTFLSEKSGNTQITVYTLDGRQIISVNEELKEGLNSYNLTIPKGVYFIRVTGPNYNYCIKAISQSSNNLKPDITFISLIPRSKKLKSTSAITSILYSTGDQLLYKGKSGNFTTIVTDKPNSDKVTNFEFVECKDADGNNYGVVKIGTQLWMAENLMVKKYNNGDNINSDLSNNNWLLNSQGSYTIYPHELIDGLNSNEEVLKKYGALYNWKASIDKRGICPSGFYIPSSFEFYSLTLYIGENEADKLRSNISIPSIHPRWIIANPSTTNEYGFSAIPSGLFDPWSLKYNYLGNKSFLRTSTIQSFDGLGFSYSAEFDNSWSVIMLMNYAKDYGFCVRCMKMVNGNINKPTVYTLPVTNITSNSVSCGSDVTNNGGARNLRGLVWSKNPNPTLDYGNYDGWIGGIDTGVDIIQINDLEAGTVYYIRAHATNISGTAYGEVVSFTTNN